MTNFCIAKINIKWHFFRIQPNIKSIFVVGVPVITNGTNIDINVDLQQSIEAEFRNFGDILQVRPRNSLQSKYGKGGKAIKIQEAQARGIVLGKRSYRIIVCVRCLIFVNKKSTHKFHNVPGSIL